MTVDMITNTSSKSNVGVPLISFTEVTNQNGLMTKNIKPDGIGGIVKKPASNLTQGVTVRRSMPFVEFTRYLPTLNTTQAIIHGVTKFEKATLVSEKHFKDQPTTVTRSKKFFSYPKESYGLGLFDHDPKPGQKLLKVDEFIAILSDVWPEFKYLPKIYTPSTSSCIYDNSGNQLTGENNGYHLYFPFKPAEKLPALAEWLFKMLWLAEHGYIFITKAGTLLERTIFDKCVFSPERIDFVTGANCIGCVQKLPAPRYHPTEEVEPCSFM